MPETKQRRYVSQDLKNPAHKTNNQNNSINRLSGKFKDLLNNYCNEDYPDVVKSLKDYLACNSNEKAQKYQEFAGNLYKALTKGMGRGDIPSNLERDLAGILNNELDILTLGQSRLLINQYANKLDPNKNDNPNNDLTIIAKKIKDLTIYSPDVGFLLEKSGLKQEVCRKTNEIFTAIRQSHGRDIKNGPSSDIGDCTTIDALVRHKDFRLHVWKKSDRTRCKERKAIILKDSNNMIHVVTQKQEFQKSGGNNYIYEILSFYHEQSFVETNLINKKKVTPFRVDEKSGDNYYMTYDDHIEHKNGHQAHFSKIATYSGKEVSKKIHQRTENIQKFLDNDIDFVKIANSKRLVAEDTIDKARDGISSIIDTRNLDIDIVVHRPVGAKKFSIVDLRKNISAVGSLGDFKHSVKESRRVAIEADPKDISKCKLVGPGPIISMRPQYHDQSGAIHYMDDQQYTSLRDLGALPEDQRSIKVTIAYHDFDKNNSRLLMAKSAEKTASGNIIHSELVGQNPKFQKVRDGYDDFQKEQITRFFSEYIDCYEKDNNYQKLSSSGDLFQGQMVKSEKLKLAAGNIKQGYFHAGINDINKCLSHENLDIRSQALDSFRDFTNMQRYSDLEYQLKGYGSHHVNIDLINPEKRVKLAAEGRESLNIGLGLESHLKDNKIEKAPNSNCCAPWATQCFSSANTRE